MLRWFTQSIPRHFYHVINSFSRTENNRDADINKLNTHVACMHNCESPHKRPSKKNKKNKKTHTVAMVTVQSITFANTHTHTPTQSGPSSGTAVRGDSYVDKRLQDERGGMMSVAETGKGDQAAWTSEQDSHTFRLDKNICSHGQFYKRVWSSPITGLHVWVSLSEKLFHHAVAFYHPVCVFEWAIYSELCSLFINEALTSFMRIWTTANESGHAAQFFPVLHVICLCLRLPSGHVTSCTVSNIATLHLRDHRIIKDAEEI